jgi:hypothetical protein
MMSDASRCEPPPEHRAAGSTHWLLSPPDTIAPQRLIAVTWKGNIGWGFPVLVRPEEAAARGWTYHAPCYDPADIARIVRSQRTSLAAMEGAGWDEPPGTDGVVAEARRAIAPFTAIPEVDDA